MTLFDFRSLISQILNTFDFQNETDMDDIHVTVLWVVSLTRGKVRATLRGTSSIFTETLSLPPSRPKEAERMFQ